MRKTWEHDYTGSKRYDDMGIVMRILNLSMRTDRREFDVIDACCSIGVAMKECKLLLEKERIMLHTTGIDMSDHVAKRAEAILDRFIRLDMLEYDGSLDSTADIVVCVNALRFVPGNTRHIVTKNCARLLKPDGMLITDVKGYRCSHDWRGLDSLDILSVERYRSMRMNRLLSFFNPYRLYEVKSMSKNDAIEYAGRIKAGWDGMGRTRMGRELTFLNAGRFVFGF